MNKGFIKWIFLIIIALILLKYFLNWSVFDAATSEEGKGTITYIRDVFNFVWDYIAEPATFIWEKVTWPILSLAWDSFQELLEWGKSNIQK